MPTNKIIFRYTGETKKLLPEVYTTSGDDRMVLVDEDYIKIKLQPLFEQNVISIDEILVTLDADNRKHGNKFEVELSLVSSEIYFNTKQSGNDYSIIIHDILDKSISFVHKEKEKRSKK